MVMSAVDARQGIEPQGDELWLDASARDALGFAVMASVRTKTPMWDDLRNDPRFDHILAESALPLPANG